MPTEGLKNWNPLKNSATGKGSPVGTTQKNASYPKKSTSPEDKPSVNLKDILESREKLKKTGAKEGQKPDGGNSHSMSIGLILMRRPAMAHSDDEDEHENDSDISNDEWDESNDKHSTPQNPQLDSKKRSKSPDSDYGSGSELTSPSHSVPKAKSPESPKPVNSKTKSEAPPATTVTEVKDSSTRSVKGLTEMFNNLGGSPAFSS